MFRIRAITAVCTFVCAASLFASPASAASSSVPSLAPAASISVTNGANPNAVLLGSFKLQSFGSHTNSLTADDLFLGLGSSSDGNPYKNRINFYNNDSTPVSGVKSGDCDGNWDTSGSNSLTMEYQPAASDRLTITLSNTSVVSGINCSLIYSNFTTVISTNKGITISKLVPLMNYIEVSIKRDSNNYTSTLTNLTLNGATLLATFNPSGTTAKISNITSFHLGDGFKLSGTLDLSGSFGNCASACAVEVSFGTLPSHITVQKTVNGLTPATDWQFTGPKGNFSVPAIGGTSVITPLGSATYAITETTKPGFVASTACTDGANGSNSVSLTPNAGATITCTFSNVITPTYTTITVTPAQPQGWVLWEELSGSSIVTPTALDIQSPPPAAMLGIGNAALVLTQTTVGKLFFAPILTGTRLSDLLVLTYSTYIVDGQTPAIQIGWDDDGSDASAGWRGRLVFVPTSTVGTWETWNALSDSAGVWFTTWGGLPDNSCRLNFTGGCTWSQILSKFPNAIIHPTAPLGFVGVKAGSGGTGASYFDALTIAANQNITTYDFEPEIPCTTTCYADAINGNDLNGGGTIANAKKSIQAAIDTVALSGTVRVLPGSYSETASNRTLVTGGTYQFGLFFPASKPGISVVGVTAGDAPITSFAGALATINTNATNGFGPSGIFIEGDNITLQGLRIGTNSAGLNKTIEVIGDNVILKALDIADPEGSVYINDFRFDSGTNTSHVKAYTIDGNRFAGSASLDVASGAGYSGPVSGRKIINNVFEVDNTAFWPVISFNGSGSGVPWFTYGIGGAVIQDNTFSGGSQYIRIRGDHDTTQFDWSSYWTDNTYDRAVMVVIGPYPPYTPSVYTYTAGSYTFTNVSRIVSTIQEGVDIANPGETVLAKPGTYTETLSINKPITVAGDGGDVKLQSLSPGIIISTSGVTLNNLAINGTGSDNGVEIAADVGNTALKFITVTNFNIGLYLNPSGAITNTLVEDSSFLSNTTHGIWSQNFNVDGFTLRRVNASYNSGGTGRGMWLINGTKKNITIEDSSFINNGLVGIDLGDGEAVTVTISNNTVSGNRDSGIGALGLRNAVVQSNTVTDNGRFGMEIKNPNGDGTDAGPNRVLVQGNTVSRSTPMTTSIDGRDLAGIAVMRRSVSLPINPDVPLGVVLRNNTVNGFVQQGDHEGFGILVEGVNSRVYGNTASGNEVGLQVQQSSGRGYPGSNDTGPANPTIANDAWFDRANAQQTCVNIGANTLNSNSIIDYREIGNPGLMRVFNMNTSEGFCTIQAAIDDADTLAGHTISATTGTYAENIRIAKAITLTGNAGVTIYPSINITDFFAPNAVISGSIIYIESSDVTIKNITLDGDNPALSGGVNINGADANALRGIHQRLPGTKDRTTVQGVTLRNLGRGIDLRTGSGHRIMGNAIQNTGGNNDGYGILLFNEASGLVNSNVVTDAASAGIFIQNHYVAGGITVTNNSVANAGIGLGINLVYGNAPYLFDHNSVYSASLGMQVTSIQFAALTVQNNAFTLMQPTDMGVLAWNIRPGTTQILTNTLSGGDVGLQLTDNDSTFGLSENIANTLLLQGNTIQNANIGVQVYAETATRGAVLTATGNTFSGNLTAGVQITGTGIVTVTAHNNNLVGNSTGISNTTTNLVNGTLNWWNAASGPGAIAGGSGDKVSANVSYCAWLTAPAPGGTAFYPVTNLDTSEGFCTIQAAIDDANTVAGHIISVTAGTYVEQVNVYKSVSLVGAGKATTFIKPPASLAGDAIGASLVGITNTASVTMNGFTVAGPKDPPLTCDPAGALTYGVRVMGNGSLNLSDSSVIDIRDNPLSGCQTGIAVRAGSAAYNEIGHLTMTNVVITGYQKGGIVVSGAGSSGILNSNIITGYGNQPNIAANSVQISGGAVATVTGNTISANKCDLAGVCTPDPITGTFSSGVLLYDAGAVVLTGNIISDTDAGIYSYAPSTPVVIEGNTLLNNRWHGIYVDEGNTTALSNTITGSLNGVVVASYLANAGDSNANVYSNTISSATNGVLVVDESITDTIKPVLDAQYNNLFSNTNGVLLDASADATASNVNHNNLISNTIGISNAAPSTLNAKLNWWNAANGPGAIAGGSGDKVSANVTTCAWLNAPAPGGTAYYPVVNVNTGKGFCSIQAAIDDTETVAGNVISVINGTFTELVTVNKSVTLLGAQNGQSGVSRCDATTNETVMNDPKGAFYVTADGVTIDGFIIQGATNTTWMGTGIYLPGNTSGHTIRNNVIRSNIFGLYLNSNGAQPTLVENNCFKNNNVAGGASGNGIYGDQGTNNVTVRGNYFTGHENTGMLFTKTGAATVSNLTIVSNTLVNDNRIRLTQASDVLISGNTSISSAIHFVQLAGGNSNITITANTVQSATLAGVRVADSDGVGVNTGINVFSNTLAGSLYGVWVGTGGVPAGSSTALNVRLNTLTGNTFGVLNEGNAQASRINRNALTLNSTASISNTDAGLLNGECNWFGSNAGPGTSVIGNVDPNPWLTGSNLLGPCALDTVITSAPISPTAVITAAFTFTGTDSGMGVTSFECRLNSGAWGACNSPITYTSGINEGPNTFDVRAIDALSNPDATPATHTWFIDTAAPDTSITSSPALTTSAPFATFAFTGTDGSGTGVVSFECKIDGGVWATCTSPQVFTGITNGPHTFAVRAIDAVGNVDPTPASFAWLVDLVAPVTSITSAPASPTSTTSATLVFTGSDTGGSGIAFFEYRLNGSAWLSTTNTTVTFSGLSNGTHQFDVRAIDKVGNVDLTYATTVWVVDAVAPNTSIVSSPASLVLTSTATLVFTGTDAGGSGLAHFVYTLDGGAPVTTTSTTLTFTGLSDGAHTFTVAAVDNVGNADATPAGAIWTVDTGAPDTTITISPTTPTSSTTAAIAFTGSDAGTGVASFMCSLDGAPSATCISPVNLIGLGNGSHTFSVYAVDGVGNADPTPASTTWVVDAVAPDTSITSSPAPQTNTASATFAFTGTDVGVGIASFECQLDGGAWATCISPKSITGLGEGTHTFAVRARDAVNNIDSTPASSTWLVDTTAPDAIITIAPATLISSTSASVSFSASDGAGSGVAGFECKLDSDPYVPCTSPTTLTGLTDGLRMFSVRSIDNVGNVETSPASAAFTVDATPPTTTINIAPPAIDGSDASFSFSGGDGTGSGLAGFECRLDGGAWAACASPAAYLGLSAGSRTFEVRARDNAGNVDASPANHTWTVDGSLPNTSITSAPPAATTSVNASIAFTGTDATTPVGQITFECSFDGSVFATCTSPFTQNGLAQGTHTFAVRAIDEGNNVDPSPATATWLVDTAAPDTNITSAPPAITSSNSAVIAFVGVDALVPASSLTFECSIDGGTFATCTSPLALTNLANGNHTFDVRAKDTAGNVDATPASTSWLVDATAPDTFIMSQPANPTDETGATFTFSSTGSLSAVTYECRLDGGAWAACATPHGLAGLADGSHTLQVRATSAAGLTDATPASFAWMVDATAPDTTITAQPPAVSGNSVSFSFSGNDGIGTGIASFECRLDAGAWTACASPQALSGLSDGSHTFAVRAIDNVGNVDGTPASFAWTVDSNLPDTLLLSAPARATQSTSASFAFVGTDDTAPASALRFECRLDGGAWSACTSPQNYSSLNDGVHVFDVRAIDPGGNADPTPASFTWTVDTVAPDTTITGGPTGLTTTTSATLTFTGSDALTAANELTFECRLNGSAWIPCSSPRTLQALISGNYTFEVRAIDQAGNVDATPASATWTVQINDIVLKRRLYLPLIMRNGP